MATTHFVAKAIILDDDDRFLLLTRSDTHPYLAGFADLPGGMIEPGEEPGEGVRREIQEETSLRADEMKVLYATTMLIKGVSYPTLLYAVRAAGSAPAVTLSWEHAAYEWADLRRLSEVEPQLAPTYQEALSYIKQNDILSDI